jgi:hypothetical protein
MRLQVEAAEFEQLERQFWSKLVHLTDWDGSGSLNEEEFARLMYAMLPPEDLSDETIKSLWAQAEAEARILGSSSGGVGSEVLAKVSYTVQIYHKLLNALPKRGPEFRYCVSWL